jgi:DNA-binding GntR family transcriptional regulator
LPGSTLERQAWLTQAELAARLGTVPDVLSRALRILADAGLIRFDRRQISILDRPGLLQRAQLVP